MTRTAWWRAALASMLVCAATSGATQAPDAPYTVEVWADVLFGSDGRATDFALQDEARYPDKFAASVKARIARARVEPPRREGKPVTLRTGVRIDFEIAPGAQGAAVRLLALDMSPLPTQRRYPAYPADLARTAGWAGEVRGSCTVSVEGQCTQITVAAPQGMPESARRYMLDTLAAWRFEPQQVDGQRVEAPFSLTLTLSTPDDKPEDFRQDRFDRLQKGR